jgi:hypothetical protein
MAVALFIPPADTSSFYGSSEFWVDPSGNDGNPGTKTQPWATYARAAAELNKYERIEENATFRVNFNSGTYVPVPIFDVDIDVTAIVGFVGADFSQLLGSTAMLAGSGVVYGPPDLEATIVVVGGLGVDTYKGKTVEVLTGDCAGFRMEIRGHTDTVISLIGTQFSNQAVYSLGDTFRIVEPAAILDTSGSGSEKLVQNVGTSELDLEIYIGQIATGRMFFVNMIASDWMLLDSSAIGLVGVSCPTGSMLFAAGSNVQCANFSDYEWGGVLYDGLGRLGMYALPLGVGDYHVEWANWGCTADATNRGPVVSGSSRVGWSGVCDLPIVIDAYMEMWEGFTRAYRTRYGGKLSLGSWSGKLYITDRGDSASSGPDINWVSFFDVALDPSDSGPIVEVDDSRVDISFDASYPMQLTTPIPIPILLGSPRSAVMVSGTPTFAGSIWDFQLSGTGVFISAGVWADIANINDAVVSKNGAVVGRVGF